jgi:RNA recognition motif-containing protein
VSSKLYVGNLPFSASDDDVRDLFENAGCSVGSVNLITDRDTGRPRGFGFVEMNDEDSAQKGIDALNGTDYGGRSLTVNVARPRGGGDSRGGRRF